MTFQPFEGEQDNRARIGAIENAAGWQILDCVITANACSGLRVGNGTRVARCSITDNAHVGIECGNLDVGNDLRGRDLVIEDNVIRNNCQWHLDFSWDSGGIKLSGDATPTGQNPAWTPARDNKIRRNKISGNWGPGIWARWDVLASEIDNNSIHANHHSGVLLEACGFISVHHNQIGDNCLANSTIAAFNVNSVALLNSKLCVVERNLLVVNRGRASLLYQVNRVGAPGSGGGGSPNVGPIEAVSGAHQVAITVGTAPRQSWIGLGSGMNNHDGAATSFPRVQQFVNKLTTDINLTVIRGFTPEGPSAFLTAYKPHWDLMKNHGVDTVFVSAFICTTAAQTGTPNGTGLANGIDACIAGGMPIHYFSPQNEPDGGVITSAGHVRNSIPPGFDSASLQITSGNQAMVASYLRAARTRLDQLGRQSVVQLSHEWRHPLNQGLNEFDRMNSLGLIDDGTIEGFCFHIYDTGTNHAIYDNRYLTKGLHCYSTETGNMGAPSAQARGVACMNHGSRMEIFHYLIIPQAVPSGDQNGQSLIDWNGNPRPWYGAVQAIYTNLQRGAVFRLCTSSDRPAGLPTTLAERMIRSPREAGGRNPRQQVAVAKRLDGRWQLVAVNASFGDTDGFNTFTSGAYAGITQQLTVTIPELQGVDLTFTARRAAASSSGMSSASTVNMKAGVMRFTLAPGESIGMTSNVAGGGDPGVPFSPQGGVYVGWFTGTENRWEDNTWLMQTNGAFDQSFADHAVSNSNQACIGTSGDATLCNVAGTGCNTLSTPSGPTLGSDGFTNFRCFIPQAADNHFNQQIGDTFRIAAGLTANKWSFATSSVQLMDPSSFVPDWQTLPTWSLPPGSASGSEVITSKFANSQSFKAATILLGLAATKIENANDFKGGAVQAEGAEVGLAASKVESTTLLRAPAIIRTLAVTKAANTQSFKAAEVDTSGENPLVREQQAGNFGWERASDGLVIITGTDLPIGFNAFNAMRFNNIAIPNGATINSATIKFTSVGSGSTASTGLIRVEQADDSAPIATTNYSISVARTWYNSDASWAIPTWADNQSDANTTTPNFSVQLQFVVNRAGWVSGNDIMVRIKANTTSGYRTYATADHTTRPGPILTIDWTA